MLHRLTFEVFIGTENAFFVTSTLIAGERDAVLIDAQFTRSDARKLAEHIGSTGKNLTTVYVTHGHPDHYWGFTTLLEHFPHARLVATPGVLAVIEQTYAAKIAAWRPLYGDEVPEHPRKPEAITGDLIALEDHTLHILPVGQGDVGSSTAVWLPAQSVMVSGDVAYNGTHVWLAETNGDQRREWIANLERLAGMNPSTVIAGHKAPDTSDEGRHVLLKETRDYIIAFEAVVSQSANAREVIDRMTAQFPNRALPMILELAANAAFPGADRERAA